MEHILVSVKDFEGPFDLLFHLIKKNKMDIREIQIAVLAEQYVEYVTGGVVNDMDNMSEFLLMAATLLDLKVRLLLPLPDDGEEEDPAVILARMLDEYRRFKEASDTLGGMEMFARQNVFKGPDESAAYLFADEEGSLSDEHTLALLFDAYETAMRNRRAKQSRFIIPSGTVSGEAQSVRQKMEYICRLLKQRRRVRLSFLFEESEDREEIAVVFQGVLLLVRDEAVKVTQEHAFGEIYITEKH